jgi:hypothetical protein
MIRLTALWLLLLASSFQPTESGLKIAVLKYRGGGDWYVNLETSLPNLIEFCNKNLSTNIDPEQGIVEVGSSEIFDYPFVHLTGHGNVVFSKEEAHNLRTYLLGGGFLHICDSYGLDRYIRPAMKMVFPELDFVELPYDHPIYHQRYDFPNGLPKIHQHDEKPAQGFGLIWEGRLVSFYDYESDLGDGWEDPAVHHDPEPVRQKALQMGANIIQFAFSQ